MRVVSRSIPISGITLWQLAIPMRRPFRHATAQHAVAEPIVISVELADHTVGYGETHPRTYVTGESHEDVVTAIREFFLPILVEMRPTGFAEAIEAVANLPLRDAAGRVITAARAAVELALLDAYSRSFGRSLETIAGWLGESWLGSPGSRDIARYSGVISAAHAKRVPWSIRKMRLFRLSHFKLKVGDRDDDPRLHATLRTLRRGLAKGTISLRLDANGAWNVDQATERLRRWQDLPIVCVEQPLPKGDPRAWGVLASRTTLPLMADESLVTPDDAEALIVQHGASWFNIRISKNGGLIPSIYLAMTARRHHIKVQLGCMVGETSILSAAGRWFLQMVPNVQFAEGSFGRFLLSEDVTPKPLRFGLGGRWKPMTGHGLGVDVDEERLRRVSIQDPIRLPL
jgi:muconate cycloisomerase